MPAFEPCTLKPGQDGDAATFFGKVTGFGYNDMISLPTLTKDSILDNLKRRFKVRSARAAARGDGGAPRAAAGRSRARPHTAPSLARASPWCCRRRPLAAR